MFDGRALPDHIARPFLHPGRYAETFMGLRPIIGDVRCDIGFSHVADANAEEGGRTSTSAVSETRVAGTAISPSFSNIQ